MILDMQIMNPMIPRIPPPNSKTVPIRSRDELSGNIVASGPRMAVWRRTMEKPIWWITNPLIKMNVPMARFDLPIKLQDLLNGKNILDILI